MYADLTDHVFTDSHDIDVVLQGGDIQEVSKEIIKLSETLSDITTLVSASMCCVHYRTSEPLLPVRKCVKMSSKLRTTRMTHL